MCFVTSCDGAHGRRGQAAIRSGAAFSRMAVVATSGTASMGTRLSRSRRPAVVRNNARETAPRVGTPTINKSAPILSTTARISAMVSPTRTPVWMAAGVRRDTGTASCKRRRASRINWS